ncbi:hypothetical protein AWC38_SpisGene4011 [Stylophora pistillata]|uniref:Uncharacterized protein n=1 Tax=Stylophora pistillata TaxID=50429 RepID=A0A2B4SQ59_STYPI|nr:hypothetical protein AWC38_SpisGene4011 [Stylophora pistillata]
MAERLRPFGTSLDYDEDLEFHFLYRDETLLAAICNFGDVFTLANEGDSKIPSRDAKAVGPGGNINSVVEDEKKFDGKLEFQHATDSVTLLQEFKENFKCSHQTTETQETDFKKTILTQVFEETVDVVRLIEKKGDCQKLHCKDELSSTLKMVAKGIGHSSPRDISNETEQTTAGLTQNGSDVSTTLGQLVSSNEEVDVSAPTVEISSPEHAKKM